MTTVPKPESDEPWRRELLGKFQAAMDRRNVRGRQYALGPSEMGGCQRGIAWKLAYGAADGKAQGWASHKGTLLHEWSDEEVFGPDDDYLSDLPLPQVVPWIAGGTLDLYDIKRKAIVDLKFPGDPSMAKARRGKPPFGYWAQLNALVLGTPVPVPSGWSTIGDLNVGDILYAGDGSQCKVVGKTPVFLDSTTYRVTFDDYTEVTCDAQHLWSVRRGQATASKARGEVVMTTLEIADYLAEDKVGRYVRVENHPGIQNDDADLPVDPYTLGMWLGDGIRNYPRITGNHVDMVEHLRYIEESGRGYKAGRDLYPEKSAGTWTIHGLSVGMRELGFVRYGGHAPVHEKHIPQAYLRSSFRQRVALLQGLMDSDGTWDKSNGYAVFNQVDSGLFGQVVELIDSLGCRSVSSFFDKVQDSVINGQEVKAIGWSHAVHFRPINFMPFKLQRKVELVGTGAGSGIHGMRSTYRKIVSIDRVSSIPVQCISVDSGDSTFLCSRSMIKTHNCYGLGALKAGLPVEKVALLFGPMCGDDLHSVAKGASLLVWPFDPQVAVDAMRSVKRIQDMLAVSDPATVMAALPTSEDFCHTRPCNRKLNHDPRAICMGHREGGGRVVDKSNPFE